MLHSLPFQPGLQTHSPLMQSPWPEQSRGQTPDDDHDQDDDDDGDDGDDECHDGDDLACFECATVSDETSLDLPQKEHFI